MRRCVYTASVGKREEFGASGGPGGGNVAAVPKLLVDIPPPKDAELTRVCADEIEVKLEVIVLDVVSTLGCEEW